MGNYYKHLFGHGGGALYGGYHQTGLQQQRRQMQNTFGGRWGDYTTSAITTGQAWSDTVTYTIHGSGDRQKVVKAPATKTRTGVLGWLDDEIEAVCAEGREVEVTWT